MEYRLQATSLAALLLFLRLVFVGGLGATNVFNQLFDVAWSPDHVKQSPAQNIVQLTLDQSSGSGFQSRNQYLFSWVSLQIKMVPGDSSGTVTAYYLSSQTANHDELDFEFLGNQTGQPYIVQTNVFANGIGGREQRIYLWFDPTTDFHSYSFAWNQEIVVFFVDETPIRVYKNLESKGVPYPSKQPMGIYSSLWNGDGWATRGGLQKINWSYAPFAATFQNFDVQNCEVGKPNVAIKCAPTKTGLNPYYDRTRLAWVKKNFMIYDYCTDSARYQPPLTECTFNV